MSDDLIKELGRLKELSETSPDSALYSLNQFINSGVESIGVWILKASIHFQLDQYSQAKVAFKKVLQRKPKNELSSIGLFHCLWNSGNTDEAFEEMKRFFKEVGSNHQSETADEYRSIVKEINGQKNS
jgi:predicted Zn-dependent protease